MRARKCFNCLGPNHQASKCYSRKRSFKCKRKHHVSICQSNAKGNPENKEQKKKDQQPSSALIAGEDQEPTIHAGVFNVIKKKTWILM